jgi:hypothetical protein
MRRIGRKQTHDAAKARALSRDIATALFNSSSRFRRQLQTREELDGIAEAVVEHLRGERWQFEKRREPRKIGLQLTPEMRVALNWRRI